MSKFFFVIFFFFLTIISNAFLQRFHKLAFYRGNFFLPASLYCSCKNIAADYYWFKLLAMPKPEVGQAWQLTSIITNLDPNFSIAYRYGAIILARQNRHDLAKQLLEKSLASAQVTTDKKMTVFYRYFNIPFKGC